MKKGLVLFAVAAAIAGVAACTTTMMHPKPIEVPPGLSLAQVNTAVAKALLGRGWMITDATKHSYDARLSGDDWEANIRVKFNTERVIINYLSSKGLGHTPSNNVISFHWNIWMRNLEHDIPAQLAFQRYGPQ